jgi:hypothetical protein
MTINAASRELSNSPVRQSVREVRARRIRLPAYSVAPTSPVVRCYNDATGADISGSVLSGLATVTQGEFVTNVLDPANTDIGAVYRIEIQFVVSSETIIRYFRVILEA